MHSYTLGQALNKNIYTCHCLSLDELLLSNCLMKSFAHVTSVRPEFFLLVDLRDFFFQI